MQNPQRKCVPTVESVSNFVKTQHSTCSPPSPIATEVTVSNHGTSQDASSVTWSHAWLPGHKPKQEVAKAPSTVPHLNATPSVDFSSAHQDGTNRDINVGHQHGTGGDIGSGGSGDNHSVSSVMSRTASVVSNGIRAIGFNRSPNDQNPFQDATESSDNTEEQQGCCFFVCDPSKMASSSTVEEWTNK